MDVKDFFKLGDEYCKNCDPREPWESCEIVNVVSGGCGFDCPFCTSHSEEELDEVIAVLLKAKEYMKA